MADTYVGIHRSKVVDFRRRRKDEDGRKKGGLYRQRHRDVVHVTAAHQEVLCRRIASITESDDYTEQCGKAEKDTENQVVSPVELWNAFE